MDFWGFCASYIHSRRHDFLLFVANFYLDRFVLCVKCYNFQTRPRVKFLEFYSPPSALSKEQVPRAEVYKRNHTFLQRQARIAVWDSHTAHRVKGIFHPCHTWINFILFRQNIIGLKDRRCQPAWGFDLTKSAPHSHQFGRKSHQRRFGEIRNMSSHSGFQLILAGTANLFLYR